VILAHVTVPVIISGLVPQLDLLTLLVGANVSSLDALPTLIRRSPLRRPLEETHASTVLHTPFFFAVVALALASCLGPMFGVSFLVGGISHILVDALDEKGRMILYPFSRKFYGLGVLTYDFWTYVTNRRIFALEALLFLLAVLVLVSG
jgi:membrane-bound metal-dependent hydrolase YbcI (DUF457 family)